MVATNGDVTSVVLLYPEDLIEWTTGDSNGGMGGLGGDPADVGLLAPDSISSNSFFLPLSNTSDVVDIESSTNVQVDGMWIFGVDNETLRFPGNMLFQLQQWGSVAACVLLLALCLWMLVLLVLLVLLFFAAAMLLLLLLCCCFYIGVVTACCCCRCFCCCSCVGAVNVAFFFESGAMCVFVILFL